MKLQAAIQFFDRMADGDTGKDLYKVHIPMEFEGMMTYGTFQASRFGLPTPNGEAYLKAYDRSLEDMGFLCVGRRAEVDFGGRTTVFLLFLIREDALYSAEPYSLAHIRIVTN